MSRFAAFLSGAVVVALVCALAAGAVSAVVPATSVTPTPISNTLPLRTAIFDPTMFNGPQEATAFARTRAAGATYVRLYANWDSLAPATLPAHFNGANPAFYSWTALDASVTAAEHAGLTPILDAAGTPAWAYATQPGGGGGLGGGVPSAYKLGRFAAALATHYDGRHGAPAVHVFQVWNEPNNTLYLSPPNENNAPAVYRGMVNAFAAAVHAVDPANLVVAGGLDPHANQTASWSSIAPLFFMEGVLCLNSSLRPACATQAHFDVWSHHPYGNGPFAKAGQPGEVSLGDLPSMEAVLQAGVRLRHIVSARPPQFWVTELGWDTNPPDGNAAPLALEARWTAESLYQCWRSGVSLVTWFLLQDQPKPSPYQTGLYRYTSSLSQSLSPSMAKPMVTAFRFPFVAYLNTDGSVSTWGRDATSAKASVTVFYGKSQTGPWAKVATLQTNQNGIFAATLRFLNAAKTGWLIASSPGSGNSLPFSLTVPTQHFKPWGN